jgi:hypothetical protein
MGWLVGPNADLSGCDRGEICRMMTVKGKTEVHREHKVL